MQNEIPWFIGYIKYKVYNPKFNTDTLPTVPHFIETSKLGNKIEIKDKTAILLAIYRPIALNIDLTQAFTSIMSNARKRIIRFDRLEDRAERAIAHFNILMN